MRMGLATATQGGGLGIGNLLILVLPLLLLFFLMTTQRRRMRAVTQLQDSLQVGQEVVTTSGMYGRIVAFEDPVAVLEIAPGVHVRFARRAIGARAPGAPVIDPNQDRPPMPDVQ